MEITCLQPEFQSSDHPTLVNRLEKIKTDHITKKSIKLLCALKIFEVCPLGPFFKNYIYIHCIIQNVNIIMWPYNNANTSIANEQVSTPHAWTLWYMFKRSSLYLTGVAVQTFFSDCSLLHEFITASWGSTEVLQFQLIAGYNRPLTAE